MDLYLSPAGRDQWSGRLPQPAADGSDGPLLTVARARDRVRELKQHAALDGPVTVWLRGGSYPLREPVVFGPADSGAVTYAAYPGETPVLDGGRAVTGWREEIVNGRTAWVVDLPEVAAGRWHFRQLFVDGVRRPRARLPKGDFYWIESAPETPLTAQLFEGSDVFVCRDGDVAAWSNLSDVEVVVTHFWIEERLPIESFDPATRTVRTTYRSTFCLKDDFQPRYARYYVENVFEALSEPGEWYLDRRTGRLTYLPLPGETIEATTVVAPQPLQLLKLVGDPDAGQYVEHLRFVGLTFQHSDWLNGVIIPDQQHAAHDKPFINAYQGAFTTPGTIYLEGARYCAIEDCTIQHVGWYGVELADGCRGNRVVGNELVDLGAGGVKLNGATADGPRCRQTGDNRVTDNHISGGGRVFHSATGILCRHSFGNRLCHNHIHDLFYSGISCGWVWGYGENVARDNLIDHNHIHDLGQGLLSDMGGVYTLGVQPGTTIRGNLIHDIERLNYGGWAIYPDEGSSHLIIENNVCYRTDSQVFHQHYGRENTIRNNLFAFGAEAVTTVSRPVDDHLAVVFERNILIADGSPIFTAGGALQVDRPDHASDLNLVWDLSGREPVFRAKVAGEQRDLSLAEWQALGLDQHSVMADPGCADPRQGDFTLPDDSPAYALGFQPIDLSQVGPRPREERD